MKKTKVIRIFLILILSISINTINAQIPNKEPGEYYFYPKLNKEVTSVDIAKAKIKNFIESNKVIRVKDVTKDTGFGFLIKNVEIYNDSILFTKGKNMISIVFKDLINYKIVVNEHVFKFSGPGKSISYYYLLMGNVSFFVEVGKHTKADGQLALELAGYFNDIRHFYYQDYLNQELVKFKPIIEKYRELKEKPTISEEQRKYIVQANALVEQKKYSEAINLFQQALKIDLTSYPEAYSNLALLFAQINDYESAIYHMKLYLMLMPDAPDARSSQDKIYEWEL
ncbi:MAG: tetratricopeptide repeat protein [Lutibacter sp.]|jgi:hypothetical protein